MNEIQKAVAMIGGFAAAGRICGRSGQAVMKWAKKGRLPRTEATGETQYAELMARAHPEINKSALLATVIVSATDRRHTPDRRANPCAGRRASDKGQAA